MNFQRGDIVTFPNTNIFFQVQDVPYSGTVFCKIVHNMKVYPITLDLTGLVKTSIH